jgi:hypothetical protein
VLYVTPEKYRTMGFGIDLADIEDVELAAILERASSLAEGYCAVPSGHSFFGGSVVGEQHDWTLPISDLELGRRRIWPLHWPIKTISAFRVNATNTQYVDVADTELFINNADRYVEVVSFAFTSVGLFGAGIPGIGLINPVASISYTYGWSFHSVNESLYPTDARTYRASHQFWDVSATDPVIFINGTEVDPGDYEVDAVEGMVVFDNQLAATDRVTADYDHALPWQIRDAVGELATYLLVGRSIQSRSMGGIQTLKVGEVSVTTPTHRLTELNISQLVPTAAWLLDAFRYITIR